MPGGESVSTIFVSVSDVMLSVNDNLIGFTKINLGWSFRLVISDLGFVLEEDLIIILAVVGVSQWVVPGGQTVWHGAIFESVSNIVLSVDYNIVELSVIWGNSPLNKGGISSSKEGEFIIIV